MAVDESADMIVVLMRADYDVERCTTGLRRDRCHDLVQPLRRWGAISERPAVNEHAGRLIA
jgi:hypothetical protein